MEKILAYMLVNYNFTSGIGLMHGKMGGALFFFLYARFTRMNIYEEYADFLMEDIINKINNEVSIDFETGLSGIGWCIEYLLSNKYISGNSDEILVNFDKKIMCIDTLRIEDFSFETGLGGILLYINTRIKSYDREMPFDIKYLKDLEFKVDTLDTDDKYLKDNIDEFKRIMSSDIDYGCPVIIPDFVFGDLPWVENNISDFPLGIHKGLTGIALKNIIL
jgi:hypothetical protein